ncbi:unnamed protein product [Rotaria magnacalcarata]|uniref:Uncharacterized protein n=2 Tax=Rotaria magnacalcarata TaxID=392030 RepID=A0A819DNF1_9BILA|nr:unnamed protein product [Rotaria magnacalcarata]CAF3937011.1 unnamed protein product [Rotaria magnacalcarata]
MMPSTTASNRKSSTSSTQIHSAQAENVQVESVVQTQTQSKVGMENSKKITDLMTRLGTTHLQIEKYSRKRNDEINDAVLESIKKIVADTQEQQQHLLADANLHTTGTFYSDTLQDYIAKLDNEKATALVQLEKDLDVRQQVILESARKRIDDLNTEANRLKMNVLKEAQAQSCIQMTKITEQVAVLEHEEAARRLASTTKTIITTKSVSASEAHPQDHPTTNDQVTTHVEALKSPSSSSTTSTESRQTK